MDAELLKLEATLMGAMSGLFTGFLGRRSIRWWRHANVALCLVAAEILGIVLLALTYVSQVPDGTVMDLFARKTSVPSP